jgi:hypothetical protein
VTVTFEVTVTFFLLWRQVGIYDHRILIIIGISSSYFITAGSAAAANKGA